MTTTTRTQPQPTIPVDTPPRLTWEEFLTWAEEDTRAEWVNGEVLIMSPAEIRHQLIMKFLGYLVDAYLNERPIGQIIPPPFVMRLPQKPSGREPDLIFLHSDHQDRLKNAYLDGPADMVVEIISEESQDRDRGAKFVEYEQGGVTEYWLIDPLREHADFYHLGEDGRYDRLEQTDDGRYHSLVLPGLSVDPAWLWRDPPPGLSEALQWVREMLN